MSVWCEPPNRWGVHFQTIRAVPGFPVISMVCGETQNDESYYHEGRKRADTPHCLFKYTLSGEGVFRDDDGEHRVTKEHGFLCRIRDPRTYYYYPKGGTEPWNFVWINFSGECTDSIIDGLLERFGPVYNIPLNDPAIKRLMSYRSYDGTERLITPSEGARTVLDLLAALAKSYEKSDEEDPGNLLVRRAQEVVRENLSQNINASDLAHMLQVSREHLARVFREQTGTTPYKYILRRKMILAGKLLEETGLTNKEIAARLGYDTPAHFTRAFKSVTHMTPSDFREYGGMPFF